MAAWQVRDELQLSFPEERLLGLGEKEIPSSQVGELVMRELRRLDKIAYIRFASVYRSFEDVSEFRDMLDEFSSSTPRKG